MLVRRLSIRSLFAVGSLGVAAIWLMLTTVDAQTAGERTAASSSKRQPWTTSRIHGSPEKPEPYRVVSAFPELRFEKPTSIEELPGSKRLLITEMAGKVFSFPKDYEIAQADLLVDLQSLLPAGSTQQNISLFDAECHPKFVENGYLFLCYVHPEGGGLTRVSRFTLDRSPAAGNAPPKLLADSEQVVIKWPSGGHNGGCLEFGTDGYLYISTGDGSGPNPPDGLTTGQTVDDLLGAVLRIDVDRAAGERTYTVPSGNPFVALSGARPEIYSYGLRNPWKFGIDPQTGGVFVADNGWETWEVVHRLAPGSNCGWPVMEGRAALRSEVKVGPTPIVPPIKDHSHTEANSVIGGPVYRGKKLPGLNGAFVYGDYITGTIWSVQPDEDNSYAGTTLCDTDLRIVAFTEASAGEIYVLDYDATGKIYELLPSDKKDNSATFPRKLSETGLFVSDPKTKLKELKPAAGVVPYSVVAPRWMDGAEGARFVAAPGTEPIPVSYAYESLTYPEGTVFAKNVTLPNNPGAIRLETQILHYEDGTWRPYSYLWNDEGTDAELVSSVGTSKSLRQEASVAGPGAREPLDRTWHVNAVNECKLCHNVGPKFILGFTPQQLDLSGSPSSGPAAAISNLMQLSAAGIVAPSPSPAGGAKWSLVDPHDPAKPFDDRARSYLHANCSACHHPGGNAIVSFFLRRDLPFEKLNTNKGTGIGTFGLSDAKLIVPGEPSHSVLLYRMSKLGYARMPYIGSRVVDSRGVALIDEWIRSLSPNAASSVANMPAEDAVKNTSDALALVAKMHGGKLPEAEFQAAVAAGVKTSKSDVRGLFETFIPESQRRATLGPTIDPLVILGKTGDHDRGKLIYFSDGARCRNCHELDDKQKSIGPTLQEITKKYPSLGDMVQHVLNPSLKIDDPFAAYSVVTDDGRTLIGLIVEQNVQEVVLKTPERLIVRLPRKSIEELKKSDKSLMPDRILSDLTSQEAADLFEYVRSQKAPPKSLEKSPK
ncbi:MAG: PQQ-dependent sugar dehydrogenase [Planctomycetia bacterium]|nr:PQQ-dependent sugar dehydrogenase [Planctomycetia bacterium]